MDFTFSENVSAMLNAISPFNNSKYCHRVYFPTITITRQAPSKYKHVVSSLPNRNSDSLCQKPSKSLNTSVTSLAMHFTENKRVYNEQQKKKKRRKSSLQ